jgi:hypothetical protein
MGFDIVRRIEISQNFKFLNFSIVLKFHLLTLPKTGERVSLSLDRPRADGRGKWRVQDRGRDQPEGRGKLLIAADDVESHIFNIFSR